LPHEQLKTIPPLLRGADLGVIESQPGGKLKQISVLTFVAAPAKVVHDVVADLSHHSEFVRNMTESKTTQNSDGTVDQKFVIRYSLVSLSGTVRSRFEPDGSIDQWATDPNDNATYRWEFVAVPGGTVLAMYGYTDVMHSPDVIRSVVRRDA